MTSTLLWSLVCVLPSAGPSLEARSVVHTVALSADGATADLGCCPAGCVAKVICVPEWVVEKRRVKVTCFRQEEKTREVIVYKQVQVTKQLEKKCTKFVPVTKTEEQKYTVCTPVSRDVEHKIMVDVPRQEIRHGTRKVCRLVPGTCDCYETVEEPFEHCVTVHVKEERCCKGKVWETKKEEKVALNKICTIEPRVTVTKYDVTVCEWQPQKKLEKYMGCVPYTEEKEVDVCVCRMVRKTVFVPACCE